MKTTDPTIIDFKKKFDLTGKNIVITGACGLIGRAFCEAVLQFGGSLIAADIDKADPESFAATLQKRFSQKIKGFVLDVESRESVTKLKEFALENFGRIDGLVNAHQNKSHLIFEPFEKVSDENWKKVVDVNRRT